MLNRISRAGVDPAVDGDEARLGFVHLALGPPLPAGNRGSSIIYMEGSPESFLDPNS
jgi:hypothetical protein